MVRQISVYVDDWQYDELQKSENKSETVREALDQYFQNQKEEKDMTKKEIINQLKGKTVLADYDWLKKNDPEQIDWVYSSEYWGRGFDYTPDEREMYLELYFNECGVAYIATYESHPQGVRQSLNNQPHWGEDNYEDWEKEQLEKYAELI